MGSQVTTSVGRDRQPWRSPILLRSKPINPPTLWARLAKQAGKLADQLENDPSSELRKKSLSLRYRVLSGEPVDHLLPDAFALVMAASKRTTGMRPFQVQILGGIAMHFGHIAVMQTGEGKTLTATMPIYLAALADRGAHLATANDYLASRDAKLMGPIFELLGLTLGVVQSSTSRPERVLAYQQDITYTTAKEIGFDFLRDRLLKRRLGNVVDVARLSGQGAGAEECPVQRDLSFVIVDEADSILIDEARTPLIISSLPEDGSETAALYRWTASEAEQFLSVEHFELDETSNTVQLTNQGRLAVRKSIKPESIRTIPMLDIYEQMELAILARERFLLDRHYVLRDGEVVIVDEFTGRIAEGRKWRAGIHQAIEAKEHLPVTPATKESARITLQDLFLKYENVAGMTGTVANSSTELRKIYSTQPVQIPTNRPVDRTALPDRVFRTADEKWNAIVEEICELRANDRPCLIGTRSIDKSETLSSLLTQANIPHEVLNARQLAREAEIVAQAGQEGRITVATNMAGRGTDIQLSEAARAAGGLHVVISELHESARIDRQLIGRCGRQGDPGTYRFFMSLEDDILEKGLGASSGKRFRSMASRTSNLDALARTFRQAQTNIEKQHFHSRKMLLFHERQRQSMQREMGQDPYVDTVT